MRKTKLKKTGFSFIELLFASVITFSLILGTAQLTIHSMIVKKRSDYRLNACSIISSQLDQLRSLFFSGGDWQEGTFSEIIRTSSGNQSFILRWNIQQCATGMQSVELRCCPENSPQMETHLLLFLSDELGF